MYVCGCFASFQRTRRRSASARLCACVPTCVCVFVWLSMCLMCAGVCVFHPLYTTALDRWPCLSLTLSLSLSQDALARSRMSMHDFSRVLGLLPLSPQASPLSHPWPPRGGGSGGLSGAAALAAHRADPAAGTGPATCIDALTEQVAGVRSEALVLAERMGVLTDSLQRSPAARSRA